MRRRRSRRRYRACFYELAVHDGEEVLVVSSRLQKRFMDVHHNDFKGTGCWRRLKFVYMAVCRTNSCSALALTDYAFKICSHVGSVKFAS